MAISRLIINIYKTLLLASFLFAAAACTWSQPSEDLAKETWLRFYGKYIQQDGHELVEFKKTKGVAGEDYGIKTYEYYYEVKMRCKKDALLRYEFPQNQCKSGEVVSATGIFHFIKTESGWKV